MSQSSLLTWLNKPVSVKKAASPPEEVSASEPLQPKISPPATITSVETTLPGSQLVSTGDSEERNISDLAFGRRPPPPNVEFRACTKDDIPHLKRLTSLLLPIPYPDRFYKEIMDDPVTANITLLAIWHDDPTHSTTEKGRLVGAIRCRLLASSSVSSQSGNDHADAPMLYLSTLVLLSPYRQHGIATHLLRTLMQRAVNDYGVVRVGAHVWEANSDAIAWYRKRGFRETGSEAGYYRRLDPQTAIVMERKVGVTDLLSA